MRFKKEIIVIGDRLLISPDDAKEKTDSGLYLPPTVREKEKIQCGYVMKTGPGYAIPNPSAMDDEPWKEKRSEVKYIPLQAEEGDYVMYLKDQAIEIHFDGSRYYIVPQSAVMVIVRNQVVGESQSND